MPLVDDGGETLVRDTEVLPQLIGEERKPLVEGAARTLIVLLVMVTWVGSALGSRDGSMELVFLPICATIWFGADLLTAILLLSQFNVDGKVSLLVVASGYAFSGLLSVPYLLLFPDIFFASNAETLQFSAWLFFAWHMAFPICLATAQAIGFRTGAPTVERSRIGLAVAGSMALVVVVAGMVVAWVWGARASLPIVILPGGQFSPLYSHVVAPSIVLANAAAFCALVGPRWTRSPLQSWLGIALLAAVLDGFLNAISPGRYSVSWYAGKLEATLTATSVLVLLLVDIATLYRRLFDVASKDALTGLANRNGLQERMPSILADARAGKGDVALLVIDIDYFKRFNDTLGHAAGDDALRRIAALLKQPLRRSSDVVARIGGEEFIVLLPSTSAQGALLVGERIRADVEAADIANPSVPMGKVTVSIGISIVRDSSETTAHDLFAIADQALYLAKADGRNRVVLETELRLPREPEPVAAPSTAGVTRPDLELRLKPNVVRPL